MKKRKRTIKYLSILLLSLMLLPLISFGVSAEGDPDTSRADAAYLYCFENEQVLFSQNSQKQIYPASTVKLMTGILALEHYKDNMDKVLTVPSFVIRTVSGNHIEMKTGEEFTVEQLIHALIVGSANDAALVLANDIAGSVESFVTMMNEKAKELGALNTHYTNPTGIHNPSMVTTAEDIAKIAVYAYRMERFAEIASMASYSMEPTNKSLSRNIHTKNYMLSTLINPNYRDKEVNGLNAGSTNEAGSCLVATKYTGGLTYLCIVMGAEYDAETGDIYSYITAKELFNWAKKNFSYIKVLDSSSIICEIPVTMSSKTDYVTLLPQSSVELFLPADSVVEDIVKINWILDSESLEAPVASGVVVGTATVTYRDNIVARVPLVTKNSVDSDAHLFVLAYLLRIVNSVWFKISALLIFLAAVAYVLAVARIRFLKKKKLYYKDDNYFKNHHNSLEEREARRKERLKAEEDAKAKREAEAARRKAEAAANMQRKPGPERNNAADPGRTANAPRKKMSPNPLNEMKTQRAPYQPYDARQRKGRP